MLLSDQPHNEIIRIISFYACFFHEFETFTEKNSIESFGTEGQLRSVLFLLNVGALCDNLDIIQVFMINWNQAEKSSRTN